ARRTVGDGRAFLADAPGAVTGLVFDRGVPPTVVQHDVAGRGQVEAGAARLQRQHERPGTLALLELLHHPVSGSARQAAVVARDGETCDLGEVVGHALAPFRE